MSDSLRFKELFPTPMKTSTRLLRKKAGESIPSFEWYAFETGVPGDRWLLGKLSRTTPPFISGPPVNYGTYLAYPTTIYQEIWDSRIPGLAGERMMAGPSVNCIGGAFTVVLTGPTETRPTGTGGTAAITLTAKVADSATPKAGIAVQFSVDVTPNSGGHEHDDPSRPKGSLSIASGTTDANGEVKLTFKAPEVAGIHTVKATCATCSNTVATKEVQVKVPGLVEMKPDTGTPASYRLVGSNHNHASNHWFTSGSVVTLGKVTDAMFKSGWGDVGVNDGSLIWGGLFDIKGGWAPSHHEHRTGTEVDLSVTNPRKATDEQKRKTYAELCKKDNAAFSIQTLWHQDDGYPEHFHMYLDGTGLTSQAGGGPCCTRYKTTRAKKDKNGNPVLKNGQPVQETVALCEETSPR